MSGKDVRLLFDAIGAMNQGAGGFAPFANATATFISPYVLNEALTNYIESLSQPIAPKTYGRITIVGGVKIDK